MISRRAFLAAGTGGLALAFVIPGGVSVGTAAAAFEPNAWLTITPDGAITVHITKAEMGQGIGTAFAQIVAEELEADWKDIRVDYPINDPKFGEMLTAGSWSVALSFDALSRAGAAARMMLIDAAAKRWAVDAADCRAERSVVRHPRTRRSIAYRELVARGPITKSLTAEELKAIPLKKPAQYTLVGRSMPRLDIPDKTTARARFGIDMFLPGMAYAKVAYPPTRLGKHRAVDDSAARQVKGYLQTIVLDDLVAVMAETYEAAVVARDALRITWEPGPHAQASSPAIFQEYERKARQEGGVPWVKIGDVKAGMTQAVKTHTATYTTDFLVHAPIEPMNCLARYAAGAFDLFTGNQAQSDLTRELSSRLGVDPTKIRIHQQYLGGSFGSRMEWDIALEAALIARKAGRPVKLIRSREEDFARGYHRPPTLQVISAGLDEGGTVSAWEHTIVTAYPSKRWAAFLDELGRDPFSLNGADHFYDMTNQLVRAIQGEHGYPVGFYRSVAPGYTFFALEAFLDELAQLATVDPLQMRLAMLKNRPRLVNVLTLAAARAGWGTRLPANVGRGLACATGQDRASRAWTAAVVQARVDPASGEVAVEKITCVVDCGLVINPDGVRAQLEGGLLFGLSGALKEYGSVIDGSFAQKNFDDYPVLRMHEVPEVELHVVESTEPPSGAGEPTVTVVAPALANAIFAATGARVRQLPFLPTRVLKALKDKA